MHSPAGLQHIVPNVLSQSRHFLNLQRKSVQPLCMKNMTCEPAWPLELPKKCFSGDPVSRVSAATGGRPCSTRRCSRPHPRPQVRRVMRWGKRNKELNLNRSSLILDLIISSRSFFFLLWHCTRRTARRTHGSVQCATSVCRAPKGP